jgi:hypothetical protein
MGLQNGSIQISQKKPDSIREVVTSHADGEVWGLSCIEGVEPLKYITSGDDNNLYLYDADTRKVIGKGKVSQDETDAGAKGKKFNGRASSMSMKKPHCQSRALAFNKDLNHLAVA